ncbi:hypothetical protein DENSPDRAFT_318216 [Dentipellis sp. KUC8613]|nr:hypothetical protein DENSPDRAFT_318216 [Dentipellis sp. KUC8613]
MADGTYAEHLHSSAGANHKLPATTPTPTPTPIPNSQRACARTADATSLSVCQRTKQADVHTGRAEHMVQAGAWHHARIGRRGSGRACGKRERGTGNREQGTAAAAAQELGVSVRAGAAPPIVDARPGRATGDGGLRTVAERGGEAISLPASESRRREFEAGSIRRRRVRWARTVAVTGVRDVEYVRTHARTHARMGAPGEARRAGQGCLCEALRGGNGGRLPFRVRAIRGWCALGAENRLGGGEIRVRVPSGLEAGAKSSKRIEIADCGGGRALDRAGDGSRWHRVWQTDVGGGWGWRVRLRKADGDDQSRKRSGDGIGLGAGDGSK